MPSTANKEQLNSCPGAQIPIPSNILLRGRHHNSIQPKTQVRITWPQSPGTTETALLDTQQPSTNIKTRSSNSSSNSSSSNSSSSGGGGGSGGCWLPARAHLLKVLSSLPEGPAYRLRLNDPRQVTVDQHGGLNLQVCYNITMTEVLITLPTTAVAASKNAFHPADNHASSVTQQPQALPSTSIIDIFMFKHVTCHMTSA
jgi:hypothetical protein